MTSLSVIQHTPSNRDSTPEPSTNSSTPLTEPDAMHDNQHILSAVDEREDTSISYEVCHEVGDGKSSLDKSPPKITTSPLIENATHEQSTVDDSTPHPLTSPNAARGVSSLPGELLGEILVLSCRPQTTNHIKLAAVCGRFRDIVMGRGELWTHVCSVRPLDYIKLQVARSGSHKLSIDFVHHCEPSAREHIIQQYQDKTFFLECKCAEFCSVVVKHKDRWLDATLSADFMHLPSAPDGGKPCDIFDNLELPSLETLSLPSESVYVSAHHPDSEICYSWRMPALKVFRGNQRTRAMEIRSFQVNNMQLKSLHLTTGTHVESDEARVTVKALLEFLAVPTINHVEELTLVDAGTISDHDQASQSLPALIVMPRVRVLTLEFHRGSCYIFMDTIARRLSFPALERIEFAACCHWPLPEESYQLDYFYRTFEGIPEWIALCAERGVENLDSIVVNTADDRPKPKDGEYWYADLFEAELVKDITSNWVNARHPQLSSVPCSPKISVRVVHVKSTSPSVATPPSWFLE